MRQNTRFTSSQRDDRFDFNHHHGRIRVSNVYEFHLSPSAHYLTSIVDLALLLAKFVHVTFNGDSYFEDAGCVRQTSQVLVSHGAEFTSPRYNEATLVSI